MKKCPHSSAPTHLELAMVLLILLLLLLLLLFGGLAVFVAKLFLIAVLAVLIAGLIAGFRARGRV
jgi:K+-transporting ATPase A subunit